jgi:hypothetical protein
MTWCLKCGEEGHPVVAIGADEDGEPACHGHAAKTKASFAGVLDRTFPDKPAKKDNYEVDGEKDRSSGLPRNQVLSL